MPNIKSKISALNKDILNQSTRKPENVIVSAKTPVP